MVVGDGNRWWRWTVATIGGLEAIRTIVQSKCTNLNDANNINHNNIMILIDTILCVSVKLSVHAIILYFYGSHLRLTITDVAYIKIIITGIIMYVRINYLKLHKALLIMFILIFIRYEIKQNLML